MKKEDKLTNGRTEEISRILARIALAWFKCPQLRLCQLVGNCFPAGDNYGRTDAELLERLKACYPMAIDEEKDIDEMSEDVI